MVRAVEGVQPGLAADETQGMRRAHCNAQDAAGVAIEPAGNVQRQHRPGEGIDARDQLGPGALNGSSQADAEQAVDYQPVLAGRDCFCRANQGHRDALLPEEARHDSRIATVIAGAGQNQYGCATSLQQLPCIFGRGVAGAFHQRWPGSRVAGFEGAQLAAAQEGGAANRDPDSP
jgi:hypothetical protein